MTRGATAEQAAGVIAPPATRLARGDDLDVGPEAHNLSLKEPHMNPAGNISLGVVNQEVEQLKNTVDGLRNQVEVMEHVLKAIVASHPKHDELQKAWQDTCADVMERTRPKASHISAPTRQDWLYQTFRKWEDIVHAGGKTG